MEGFMDGTLDDFDTLANSIFNTGAAYQDANLIEQQSISALELFEKGLTKKDLKVMAAAAVESVLHQANPLQVAEALTAMETFCKEVKDTKAFKDYVREEASKSPKGFISNSGAKIELTEVGTSYDFSGCNDGLLLTLEEELKQKADLLDERKKFLKTVPASGLDLVTPDGEVIKIYPPTKTSTSSYKITLAK